MAGNFGAVEWRLPLPHKSPPLLFKPSNRSSSSPTSNSKPFLPGTYYRILTSSIKMAENGDKTHTPEIKEPSPKIPKLHHQDENGVQPSSSLSFFKVKKLSHKAVLPSRASPLSAGYDLSSAVEASVPARGKALIATDLSIAIPEGTYARIAPRSGLAWKHSIDVAAGVIDADYRGPVGVILFNHSDVDFEVKVGDRIAQLIIQKIMTPEVFEVDDLDATVRGAGGFGSTGV